MADSLTPQQRHRCMSNNRSSSTKPETKLRKELWKRGFRYRLNDKRLPGSPDIVLPKYRTVIFVHGCFWHGHEGCKKYVVPKSNTQFWVNKVTRNRGRDEKVWRQLEALDWAVVIVWECELEKKNFDATVARVEREIKENGEAYQRHKKERALYRQQHLLERKEHKMRHLRWLSAKKHIMKQKKLKEVFLDWNFDEDEKNNYKFLIEPQGFSLGDRVNLCVYGRPEFHWGAIIQIEIDGIIVHTEDSIDISESYSIEKVS